MSSPSRIGERIRRARKLAGQSQEGLADRIKVNRSYLSLVENGKSSPTYDFLEKVAAGLGIKAEELVLGPEGAGTVGAGFAVEPRYEGLAELLRDDAQMLLMNPTPEELDILKSISVNSRFQPSKKFFIEALLDYRKNRLAK
jgi:transcriptional regulator with XRE-family HTH domain